MLPLVRVGAAVRADVVTSTTLFVMQYNMRYPVQAFEHGGLTAASMVVALHEACSLSLHVLHICSSL